jgi:hypothetical protein
MWCERKWTLTISSPKKAHKTSTFWSWMGSSSTMYCFLWFNTDCSECSHLSRNSAMGPQIPITIHIKEHTDVYCWTNEIKYSIKYKSCSTHRQDLFNTPKFRNRHLTDFLRLLWIVVTHCGIWTDYSLMSCLSTTHLFLTTSALSSMAC